MADPRPQTPQGPRVIGADFVPPHCPNRDCANYVSSPLWRFRKYGSFTRQSDSKTFQCFRCSNCKRVFSIRTFAGDYWLRYRRLFPQIVAWSVEGPGLRQTGRRFNVSHTTVARHVTRAARPSFLFHRQIMNNRPLKEELSIDGFETFELSQFFPYHVNLAAGTGSWFIYGLTDSPLRRKGRMTAKQRRRREELEANHGRPDPKAVEQGVQRLLEQVVGNRRVAPGTHPLVLNTDDHPAYRRSIAGYCRRTGRQIVHVVTPGTAPRTVSNPLFAVNLADSLLRHSQANHRRETIAFSKRRQGGIERAGVFMFWRNYVKWRRENARGVTAAMVLGFVSRRLGWKDLLARRRFPREELLPHPWDDYYWRRIRTVALEGEQAPLACRYAF